MVYVCVCEPVFVSAHVQCMQVSVFVHRVGCIPYVLCMKTPYTHAHTTWKDQYSGGRNMLECSLGERLI